MRFETEGGIRKASAQNSRNFDHVGDAGLPAALEIRSIMSPLLAS